MMLPAAHINLDYAASTPLRAEALEAMRSYDASPIAGANPNSLHTLGREAARALEAARRSVASSLGCGVRPQEVIFTSGGTEANVLALFGIAEAVRAKDPARTRIVVSAIEHDSILDNIPALHAAGFAVDIVKPSARGVIEPETLNGLLDNHVALVSIMFANNETGALQPIEELARAAHTAGAYVHTDAIQGYLHAPLDVNALDVDALSLAGHKVGAPVSCGALYLRRGTPFAPRSRGGGQEAGRRPGTQDVRSVLALAAVASTLAPGVEGEWLRLRTLSDALYARLLTSPRIHATLGSPLPAGRLGGIVSIYVDGFESEELILQLDQHGFCVSAGSACSSASAQASHVLTAMGLAGDAANGSLRISFDERVDPEALDAFTKALLTIVEG